MADYSVKIKKYNAGLGDFEGLYPYPMKHASTHSTNGEDPISPESIGAPTKSAFDGLSGNVEQLSKTVDELKTSVSEGKALVAGAVTDKGVQTAPNATFQMIADNIKLIDTGYNFASEIVHNKTAYADNYFTVKTDSKIAGVAFVITGQKESTLTQGTKVLGGIYFVKDGFEINSCSVISEYAGRFTYKTASLTVTIKKNEFTVSGDYTIGSDAFSQNYEVLYWW